MVSPDPADAPPPSGEQHEIRWGEQQAVITEVGAGIRTYQVAGHPILDGYAVDEMCTFARGAALIPWPNRLQDGRYTFDGRDYQTPLTEPERLNAIHGLTRWMNWQARQVDPSAVVMSLRLHPQEGYPFTLDLEILYRLSGGGLEARTTGRNGGRQPLPYTTGHHPYVTVGTDLVDDAACLTRSASCASTPPLRVSSRIPTVAPGSSCATRAAGRRSPSGWTPAIPT